MSISLNSFFDRKETNRLKNEIVRLKIEIERLQNELTDLKRVREKAIHGAYSAGFEDARAEYPFGESL